MRGVIVEGRLSGDEGGEGERVLIYLELQGGTLRARRSYGERALALRLELDDVEAALAAVKAEQLRRSRRSAIPGQTTIDEHVDHSDAT